MAVISDPILFFSVMVSVTLIAPMIAQKLKIPSMVLLLMAGAVLGPYGVGLLERNSAIMLFASVGLLYIMFLAGLEIDLHRFVSARQRSIMFGVLTFSIPQVIGTLLGRYVLAMEWPAAMLLASMFASHTLLAYPVASSLGIVRTEPVTITIGATIITDTLALLVLAVIADAARGLTLSYTFWLILALGLGALIVGSLWVIPWLSRLFFRQVGEDGNAQYLFVIGIVCIFSYLSHYANMEPIIGAFLAGIAFNRFIPEHSTLSNRVHFIGETLFIPFFLISVGMLVDLRAVLQDPRSWLVAGTMVCGVITTKWAAAYIMRYLCGYTRDEGNVMFGLSVVQAAATLAAVLVGYELKIFDESVLNGAIGMIMVTCPLGSWAVDRYGRRMVARTSDTIETSRHGGQRLLIPVINAATATHMLDLAFVLRDSEAQSSIHPIVIVPDEGETGAALADGEKLMGRCLTHAASVEVPVNPIVRIEMNVSDGIVRAAKEVHADIVMFGWGEDSNVVTRIFGSVRKRMLQECPPRLLVCRLVMPLNTTRRILMPLPPQAERRSDIVQLVREAKRLAKQLGADLRIYLCEPGSVEHLRTLIDKAPPEMPVTIEASMDWSEARTKLFQDVSHDDMAILPVERRRGALWTPSLDRLPDVMAGEFPAMNLLAAYPPLYTYQRSPHEVSEAPGLGRIVPVSLDKAPDLDSALQWLVSGSENWGAQEQLAIRASLLSAAKSYPVEMARETVLLHAHCDIRENVTLLVGMSKDGVLFPGIDEPARIILALISANSLPPERHLASLANLARMFHDKAVAESVCTAESPAAIADIIQEAFTASFT